MVKCANIKVHFVYCQSKVYGLGFHEFMPSPKHGISSVYFVIVLSNNRLENIGVNLTLVWFLALTKCLDNMP